MEDGHVFLLPGVKEPMNYPFSTDCSVIKHKLSNYINRLRESQKFQNIKIVNLFSPIDSAFDELVYNMTYNLLFKSYITGTNF